MDLKPRISEDRRSVTIDLPTPMMRMDAEQLSAVIRALADVRHMLEPPVTGATPVDPTSIPLLLPTYCRPLSIPQQRQACLILRTGDYGWLTIGFAVADIPGVIAVLQIAAAGAISGPQPTAS
jgi:hypothetical protein